MKINRFTATLCILLGAIIAFFLSSYFEHQNVLIVGVGSFITLSLSFIGAISITFEYDKTTALTRTASAVFVILNLIGHILFVVFSNFTLPTYVLIIGGITIVHALILYAISKSSH
jgi:hypothetical protein